MVKIDALTNAIRAVLLIGTSALVLTACSGDDGNIGSAGTNGTDGTNGAAGSDGQDGSAGVDGTDGANALTNVNALNADGAQPCINGFVRTSSGTDTNGDGVLDASEELSSAVSCGASQRPAPISSLVATYRTDSASNIPDYVKSLVNTVATTGTTALGGNFPLGNNITDSVRTIPGIDHNIVTQWLDPLSPEVDGPVFGSNADYVAYFGDDWNSDWGGAENNIVESAPQFNGNPKSGWLWVNHEYISNGMPAVGSAPSGQHLTYAQSGMANDYFAFDVTNDAAWTQANVDAYVDWHKKALGGSWMKASQRASGEWTTELSTDAKRYDSSSNTLLTVTGYTLNSTDIADDGSPLPAGQVAGLIGDCSGGQTPWGTILSAEENVQFYYGDLETGWNSSQGFQAGTGWDAGAVVTPTIPAADAGSFIKSDTSLNHNRDAYGFIAEIDPGVATDTAYTSTADGGTGSGHRKIGSMGRARWENATIVTDSDWELENGKPVVIYGGNDRRSGRIYKWVSTNSYTDGMTKGQVRALLDDGSIFVAHFADLDTRTGYTLAPAANTPCANADVWESGTDDKADVFAAGCVSPTQAVPGNGIWVALSTTSTDIAPNAVTLGANTTVGTALQDNSWNSIGGFADNNTMLSALFTASMKIGVMELNRPEDVEWNPQDERLYIAFTSHGRPYALDQNGVLKNGTGGAAGIEERRDDEGAIFVLQETDQANPETSAGFTFWAAWQGQRGNCQFCAENPDNLMIDNDGGVWFGTDGNFSASRGTVDSLYYLDLDPTHAAGQVGVVGTGTFGQPFRVISGPSDSEATGPAFNSDMSTIFFSVQHPGEGNPSNWPNN